MPFFGGWVPFGAGDGFELVDGYGVVGDGDLDCVVVEGDVCVSDWVVGHGDVEELVVYGDVPVVGESDCAFEVGDG